MAIVVIAIASVLQFHHHGCNGVVFIPVYDFDIAIGDTGHGHGESDCLAHAGHGHHHDDDGTDCSMHIGDTVSPGRVSDQVPVMSLDWFPAVSPATLDMAVYSAVVGGGEEPDQEAFPSGILTVNVFRGPPVL
ncbi:MAG: hypothetical protein K2L49_01055 [Muribaculaceae bacterium]|nr:hypothetical protein [Muribaculaceae bacterium]